MKTQVDTMEISQHNLDLTIIIGAGIVGSALATFLSGSDYADDILVVDRSFDDVVGSTGFAPGFIGQYNESPTLTKLAMETVQEYERLGSGFSRVGGLELACTDQGIERLHVRLAGATKAGLPAKLLTATEALALAPPCVLAESVKEALYFLSDGIADPKVLCRAYRSQARANGVRFLEAEVADIRKESGAIRGVCMDDGKFIRCQRIILATGIWTAELLRKTSDLSVPVVPVSHPYVYSTPRSPLLEKTPFLRWPESHAYARDHGLRYGLGSYDHAPQYVPCPGKSAAADWSSDVFDPTIKNALDSKMSPAVGFDRHNDQSCDEEDKTGGIFSVTPDSLPLLGRVPENDGLWIAAAIWITHAAGCARLLANVLTSRPFDEHILADMEPSRFSGQDEKALHVAALKQYNDIYLSGLESKHAEL